MFFWRIFLTFLISTTYLTFAKPPELAPKDAKKKMEEIFRAHVKYKSLSKELIKRSLNNFLEELDPFKTYFIENEIVKWTLPSDGVLEEIENDFKNDNFSHYEEIYEKMIFAIKRRNFLEKKIEELPLPKNCTSTLFKDITWVDSEDKLTERLLQLKALQIEAVDNLDSATKEQIQYKIEKRRLNREADIISSSKKDKLSQVLAYTLKSFASALDTHTAYLTPKEANQFMIQVQQKLFGIGAQLKDDLNGFSIVRLLEGGPALKTNKLKVGDRIISVNQEPVVGLDIIEVVDLIRGPQGSKVQLTFLRESGDNEETKRTDKFDIEITRDEIVLKETRFETNLEPYGDGYIAHVKLFSFYQDKNTSSAKDIREALEKMKKEHHLVGVILDLRNNAGGILAQAVSVSGLFISKGIVVSIKDSAGRIQHLRNFDSNSIWDGPLLILINKASASAAEIVAQSLQDYGRALVVGDESSFGKGSYQSFTLESGHNPVINPQGEYKVTRGIYYTVSGKSPQLHGVRSNIIIPGPLSYLEIGESFAKFPLEGDEIKENFNDDLSDVHPLHRGKMKRLYKNQLQEKLFTFSSFEEILKKNSEKRISLNHNYQNFLSEIKKTDPSFETMESFGQNDLQLEETLNIMKDFIFLLKNKKDHQEKPIALK